MDRDYEAFVVRIKDLSGIDLRFYKEAQMKRRLVSLRDQYECPDFAAFYNKLKSNKSLLDRFLDRITINVSGFYRNQKRWQVLQENILPSLLQYRQHLNIWSAACSTGEEPYTLSIMLSEMGVLPRVNILATDLDRNVLDKAGKGIYREQSFQELPEGTMKKYFRKVNDGYEIDPAMKHAVTFKRHDLLADPFPKHIDLIVCRNVCIYFTDQAKRSLYRKFNQSLKNNGILFVGSTEQIFHPEQFGYRTEETFFYRKHSSISQSEQEAMT